MTGHRLTDCDAFHADKNCPHLERSSLRPWPMSHLLARRTRFYMPDPCSYCTFVDGEGGDA